MWQKTIKEIAAKYNMEIISENSTIYFIYPRKIDESVKSSILKEVPNSYTCEFSEAPKPSTKIMISAMLDRTGSLSDIEQNKRNVSINVSSNLPVNETFFDQIDKILRTDGYFDSWKITINGQEHTGYSVSLDRTNRDTIIQKDEITNLIITLNTTKYIEDIINQL